MDMPLLLYNFASQDNFVVNDVQINSFNSKFHRPPSKHNVVGCTFCQWYIIKLVVVISVIYEEICQQFFIWKEKFFKMFERLRIICTLYTVMCTLRTNWFHNTVHWKSFHIHQIWSHCESLRCWLKKKKVTPKDKVSVWCALPEN